MHIPPGEAITRTDMNGTLRKEYVENTDAVRTMIHSRRKFREEGKSAADVVATEGVYVYVYVYEPVPLYTYFLHLGLHVCMYV